MNDKDPLVESRSLEAAHAAAISKEADQRSQAIQIEIATYNAIEKFFNRGVSENKFIDIGRIPFICDDIKGIHDVLADMNQTRVTKESFEIAIQTINDNHNLVRNIVFSCIAVILFGVLGVLGTVIVIVLSTHGA